MADERLLEGFARLTDVMARLRRECPWDRRQDHETLRRYLLEECHEVLEALDGGDHEALRGELGDLLFQVWFHAEVASERTDGSGFDLADVVEGITAKLVRRHPHVFGEAPASDAAAVKRSWERLKQEEGRTSRLDGVPRALPALLASQCLQDKAASVGFDWEDIRGVLDKVREEIDELAEELDGGGSRRAAGAELGDVLFSVVNLARHVGVAAEDALRACNRKFERRFRHIERRCREEGKEMEEAAREELEAWWGEAKERGL